VRFVSSRIHKLDRERGNSNVTSSELSTDVGESPTLQTQE
jgi:hypothetical protein